MMSSRRYDVSFISLRQQVITSGTPLVSTPLRWHLGSTSISVCIQTTSNKRSILD